jgi:hypothetical protein
LLKDPLEVKKTMNDQYTCKDCTDSMQICFICKKKGLYLGYQANKKKRENENEDNQ